MRRGLLYWRRSTLLPIFADNIRYPVREVHIALRNYADFFASAFVEFLRSAQGERVFPEVQMRRNVLSELPSWVDFMQDVQSAFRGARIIVWRHEDFNRLCRASSKVFAVARCATKIWPSPSAAAAAPPRAIAPCRKS